MIATKILATLLVARACACPIAAGHGSPLERGRFIVRVCQWPDPRPERRGFALRRTAADDAPDFFGAGTSPHLSKVLSVAAGFRPGSACPTRDIGNSPRKLPLRC